MKGNGRLNGNNGNGHIMGIGQNGHNGNGSNGNGHSNGNGNNGNGHANYLHIGIIGCGVVGEATGKAFLEMGHTVYGYDLRNLCDLKDKGFRIMKNYDLKKVDLTFIAVNTNTVPLGRGGVFDKRNLDSVCDMLSEQIAEGVKDHSGLPPLIVTRSTCLPGMTRYLGGSIEEKTGKIMGKDFFVGHNPESLRAHRAEKDVKEAPIHLIGQTDKKSGNRIARAYQGFIGKTVKMNLEEAEWTKYGINWFNASKISWGNEFFLAMKHMGLSYESYQRVMETLPKMCEGFYNPSYGTHGGIEFGGTCLPKDTFSIESYLRDNGFNPMMLSATINTNAQMQQLADKKVHPILLENSHPTYDNITKYIANKAKSKQSHSKRKVLSEL